MVGAGLLSQVVQRPQVSCEPDLALRHAQEVSPGETRQSEHTSNIGNAENSDGAALDDAALVGEQGNSAGSASVREVRRVVGVVSLLSVVPSSQRYCMRMVSRGVAAGDGRG